MSISKWRSAEMYLRTSISGSKNPPDSRNNVRNHRKKDTSCLVQMHSGGQVPGVAACSAAHHEFMRGRHATTLKCAWAYNSRCVLAFGDALMRRSSSTRTRVVCHSYEYTSTTVGEKDALKLGSCAQKCWKLSGPVLVVA